MAADRRCRPRGGPQTQNPQAKRHSDGTWEVSAPIPYKFPHKQERLALSRALTDVRGRLRVYEWQINSPQNYPEYQLETARALLPDAEAKLAEAEKAYATITTARDDYNKRRAAFGELIKQRVAQFAGAPRAEMIAGAHVTGDCAICGRELSDPTSIARGIGPECYNHVGPSLRAFLDHQAEHAA